MLSPASAMATACDPTLAAQPAGERALRGQSILWDTDGSLTLADVTGSDWAARFTPVDRQVAAGHTRRVLWLRACLPPRADDGAADAPPRWLRIGPALLDRISLFLPNDNGYEEYQSGDHLPFTQRQWEHRLFTFAIPANTSPGRPIYLRVATSSVLSLSIDLWSEDEFRHEAALDYTFYGVYLGAMLLLFAFSLVFYFWFRESIHLVFAINILAGTCIHLLKAGFGSQFLYPWSSALNDRVISLMLGPSLAIHVWLFICIFVVRQKLPRAYRAFQALLMLCVLTAPLSLVMDWRLLGNFLYLLGLLVGVFVPPLLLYIIWKDRERRTYAIAFLPWVVALQVMSATRIGWIGPNPLATYSQEIGTFIYLTILPITIARRTRRAEKAKEMAQLQALAEALRAERELEQRVAQRTDELAQEIRRRQALQGELQKALETERSTLAVQRQFVSMLSHEFRTPLAIIDATAQRMMPALEQRQPELLPKVDKIRRAVARQLNLLENCLTEERLDTPELALHLEAVDLRDFLAQNYGQTAPLASPRICLELPQEPQWVHCDRHLLDVALSNLVDNAIKYSPDPQPVTIRLSGNIGTGMAVIQVSDRGPGVRTEDRERLFNKFFRSQGHQGTVGAGLGLHLAQELVRRHGGDIALAPGGPRQGATFMLTLPQFSPLMREPIAPENDQQRPDFPGR